MKRYIIACEYHPTNGDEEKTYVRKISENEIVCNMREFAMRFASLEKANEIVNNINKKRSPNGKMICSVEVL